MRLVIAGSRDFNDYELLTECANKFVWFFRPDQVTIISGTARGADQLGERYARDFSHKLEKFPALWDSFGKRAGIIRNTEMAQTATHALIFWDGKSRGTSHMIGECKKFGVEGCFVRYDNIEDRNYVKGDWFNVGKQV